LAVSKYRVAVTSAPDFPVRVDIVRNVLGSLAEVSEVEMPFRPLSPEEVNVYGEQLATYNGILVRSGIFTKVLLKRLPLVRVIAVHGAGVDQINVEAAGRLGIYVVNAPGCNATSVAELTICLMVDLARRVSLSNCLVRRDGQWGNARYLGNELFGRNLGLLGFGQIGAKVAARAKAFGMSVSAFDPYVSSDKLKAEGVTPCPSIKNLLAVSDIVSLHMPLQSENYHIINEVCIKQMQPGALLINTSRGGLVDEKALYSGIISGQVGGAAFDVLEKEPPDPANPLLSLDPVIVTSHIGGSTQEALESIARVASKQIRDVFEGVIPKFVVNRPKI